MRIKSRTTERITPAGRRFYAQLDKLRREPYVKVGVIQRKFSEPKEGSEAGRPLTLGEVAVVNEFGTKDGRVPERSFIRSTHDEKNRDITNHLRRIKVHVVSGNISARKALEEVGAQMQAHIYDTIIELRTPPNAPSTIEAKGSDNPLINYGQLLRAIGWEYHGSD